MIKAYLALWTCLTALGTVKPTTHIMDNEASEEYKKGNTKELHNPVRTTRQSQTQPCRTSNTNLQEPLQGNPCGSRQHISNETLRQTTTTDDTHPQLPTIIKCHTHCLGTPICPRQLRLQKNAFSTNGMCSIITPKQYKTSIMGRKFDRQMVLTDTSPEHYQCHVIYVKQTKRERVSDTVFFKTKYITQPTMTQGDIIIT